MSDWHHIATAPKDGTHILAYGADMIPTMYVVQWWEDAFYSNWIEAGGEKYETFEPTHWMPLPEPPKP